MIRGLARDRFSNQLEKMAEGPNEPAGGAPPTAWLCHVTVGSRAEALDIGRAVVEERLAACANVLDGLASLYWWQGRLEEAGEALLILKTRAELVPALIARVQELHGYQCPAVVALPIVAGNPDYLRWIAAETQFARSQPQTAGSAASDG